MIKTKNKKVVKNDYFDQIRKNYEEMNEEGREKLKEISKKLLEIHKITRKNKK